MTKPSDFGPLIPGKLHDGDHADEQDNSIAVLPEANWSTCATSARSSGTNGRSTSRSSWSLISAGYIRAKTVDLCTGRPPSTARAQLLRPPFHFEVVTSIASCSDPHCP
jgi:hypothetical protein